MTAYTWKTGGVSGDWSTAGDWTPAGGPPDSSTDTALINAAGSYTVTIGDYEDYTANKVTLNAAGALLEVVSSGTLTLAGTAPTLTVSAGTFQLYGELIGGTVKLVGGSVLFSSSSYSTPSAGYNPTLDGVTWQGTLALGQYTGLDILGGLTVETASGGSHGAVDLSAGYAYLFVQDSETLNNATLNFGSVGGDDLYNDDLSGTGQTLKLGSGFTITAAGGDGGNDYLANFFNNDTIANAGKIIVTAGDFVALYGSLINSGSILVSGGAEVDLSSPALTNSGSISVGAGGTLLLGTVSNSGSISVGANGTLVIGTGFTNTGSISLGTGATLELMGSVTLAELEGPGKITASSDTLVVGPGGTLDLGGGTLDVAATGLFSDIVLYGYPGDSGTLANGTVKLAGGSLLFNSPYNSNSDPTYNATLDGVTWQGTLALGAITGLDIIGGFTVETATGGSPGSIDLSAGYDSTLLREQRDAEQGDVELRQRRPGRAL